MNRKLVTVGLAAAGVLALAVLVSPFASRRAGVAPIDEPDAEPGGTRVPPADRRRHPRRAHVTGRRTHGVASARARGPRCPGSRDPRDRRRHGVRRARRRSEDRRSTRRARARVATASGRQSQRWPWIPEPRGCRTDHQFTDRSVFDLLGRHVGGGPYRRRHGALRRDPNVRDRRRRLENRDSPGRGDSGSDPAQRWRRDRGRGRPGGYGPEGPRRRPRRPVEIDGAH